MAEGGAVGRTEGDDEGNGVGVAVDLLSEALPAGQSVQLAAPSVSPKDPCPHREQFADPASE